MCRDQGVRVEIPHVSLRYPHAPSDGSVIRSAAVTLWWAQLQISPGRSTAGVFLLGDLKERGLAFVTNDKRLVDKLSRSEADLSSLKDWYSKKLVDENWKVLMPSVKTLDRLCLDHSCLSAVLETSDSERSLVLATVQHIRPETVQSLSRMLLLFGVLHRRQTLAVSMDELHPVVASFLAMMTSTGRIDLGWLGFNEEDPEKLVWRGEMPRFYV